MPEPRHAQRQVPLSEEERERLGYVTNVDRASWGCLVFVFLGFGVGLASLGGWAGSVWGRDSELLGRWVGVAAAVAVFAAAAVRLGRYLRGARERANADLAAGYLEELEVDDARVVRVFEGEHDAVDPAVCFDIGGGKLLLLVGQWLWDEELYGAPREVVDRAAEDDEVGDRYLNRLPPPYAFPSASFALRRRPSTGDVFSIEVRGDYLEPGPGPGPELEGLAHDLRTAQVLEGSLDDLEAALAPLRRDRD